MYVYIVPFLLPVVQSCTPTVIRDMSNPCESKAEVVAYTTWLWNPEKTADYTMAFEMELADYNAISIVKLASFGTVMRTPTGLDRNGQKVYGQVMTINDLRRSCADLKMYTKNAVSYSETINYATFSCKCSAPIGFVREE